MSTTNLSSGILVNPHGTVDWTGGEVLLLGQTSGADLLVSGSTVGTEKLVSIGNNSVTIGAISSMGVSAHVDITVAGELGGAIDTSGNDFTIGGIGAFDGAINFSNTGIGLFGGPAGTVALNLADHGPVISIRQALATLDFGQLTFLQGSTGVNLNDEFGPNGVGLPPGGFPPATLAVGQLPTLEIDHLAPLKDIVLTQTDLTLDFVHGRSVTLNNVTVNDPKYFTAEQSASGSLYLSETNLPVLAGAHAVPIST